MPGLYISLSRSLFPSLTLFHTHTHTHSLSLQSLLSAPASPCLLFFFFLLALRTDPEHQCKHEAQSVPEQGLARVQRRVTGPPSGSLPHQTEGSAAGWEWVTFQESGGRASCGEEGERGEPGGRRGRGSRCWESDQSSSPPALAQRSSYGKEKGTGSVQS